MNTQLKMNVEEEVEYFCKSFVPTSDLTRHLRQKGITVAKENAESASQEEFREMRRYGFGASDAPVLMECAYSSARVPMKTIGDLMNEKINDLYDESIGKKGSVRKGKELEPLFIDRSEKVLDAWILKPKAMYTNNRGLNTNFDGVVFENTNTNKNDINYDVVPIPFEIKLCTFFAERNYNWKRATSNEEDINPAKVLKNAKVSISNYEDDIVRHVFDNARDAGIPPYYYVQLQQQIDFLDAPYGYLAVMKDMEWRMYYFKVARDQKTIDELKSRALKKAIELKEHLDIKLELTEEEKSSDDI